MPLSRMTDECALINEAWGQTAHDVWCGFCGASSLSPGVFAMFVEPKKFQPLAICSNCVELCSVILVERRADLATRPNGGENPCEDNRNALNRRSIND